MRPSSILRFWRALPLRAQSSVSLFTPPSAQTAQTKDLYTRPWLPTTDTEETRLANKKKVVKSISPLSLRLACRCHQCVDPSDGQKKFSIADIPLDIAVKEASFHQNHWQVRWDKDVPGFDQDHVSTFRHGLRGAVPLYHIQGQSPLPLVRIPSDTNRRRVIFRFWLCPIHVITNKTKTTKVQMWDKAWFDINKNSISYENFMSGPETLALALEKLWAEGLVFVTDVPKDESRVQALAERIGPLRGEFPSINDLREVNGSWYARGSDETFYGRTWDVRSKPNAENVAYTSRHLGYHMDLLYMHEPPGLQLLHCLENTCEGGESFFADTFTALHLLDKKDPSSLTALGKSDIRYGYYHPPEHNYNDSKPVTSSSKSHQFEQRPKVYAPNFSEPVSKQMQRINRVYWSPPFVASLNSAFAREPPKDERDRQRKFRASLAQFQQILNMPELRVETKLPAGTCAIFDNLRIVHAREAFDTNSGHRWLRGAYVDWQDFVSKTSGLRAYIQISPTYVRKNLADPQTYTTAKQTKIRHKQSSSDGPSNVKNLAEPQTDDVAKQVKIRYQRSSSDDASDVTF